MSANNEMQRVIAIDGPSGSGKSTVAKELAKRLQVLYIDTGAMFRALAFEADRRCIDPEEGPVLSNFLSDFKMDYGKSEDELIVVDGVNLTDKIREHHISTLASVFSQLPSVRKYLLDFQRSLAMDQVCVMEGRDIGTVVFPRAFAKFFVTASLEVRAKRRLTQLQEKGDTRLTLEQVIADQQKRDESDMNRAVAPLKQADDAEMIDTSGQTLEEVIARLGEKCRDRASAHEIKL